MKCSIKISTRKVEKKRGKLANLDSKSMEGEAEERGRRKNERKTMTQKRESNTGKGKIK